MQNNILGSLPIEALPIFRPIRSYPVGWGQPSRYRMPAGKPPYVAPQHMTRQQKRAKIRAAIKEFNRKDHRGFRANQQRLAVRK